MSTLLFGLISLISISANPDQMNSPEQSVTQLFIATDNQDWNAIASLFDTSVLLDYSSMNGSPATELTPQQIIEAWQGILPGFEHTHHQIGNLQVSTEGNKAHVFCYGTASHFLTDDAGNVWTVIGSYDFDLVQRDNQWKISAMKFNFKYQDGNLDLPQKAIEKK